VPKNILCPDSGGGGGVLACSNASMKIPNCLGIELEKGGETQSGYGDESILSW